MKKFKRKLFPFRYAPAIETTTTFRSLISSDSRISFKLSNSKLNEWFFGVIIWSALPDAQLASASQQFNFAKNISKIIARIRLILHKLTKYTHSLTSQMVLIRILFEARPIYTTGKKLVNGVAFIHCNQFEFYQFVTYFVVWLNRLAKMSSFR